ncbi:hypothetical protein D1632_10240 [Chryseobacterium nematophagum]|uniref:Uncharacterized protein n=1 Tax=Chryseobacterium nematophagum TaxID=2305228 RepID=A0A3M7LB22_9FLAO|nr:hypothetical protein [Chryseobacterium nematophagum]RMZ59968.1 hypothetical protein D1632_10240 [Chryseobacterium nematophagum]
MKDNSNTFLILLVTSIFFLNSCRNNDLLTENETYNRNIKFRLNSKTIQLDESRHKASLALELEKMQSTSNTLSKTTDREVYIDTDNITYIENGPNYHTYTFNLIRENSSGNSPLENIVLTPLSDGTYKGVLVSYNLTKQEKLTLKAGGYVNIKDKVTITELSKEVFNPIFKGAGMTTCGFVETYTIRGCSDIHNGVSTHNENNTSEWENCKADRKPGVHMTMTYRCDFISDNNSPGTGGGDGGGVDTGPGTYVPGGGSSIPCNGNGIATVPFDPKEDIGDGGCTGIPTSPTIALSTFFVFVKNLPINLQNILNNPENQDFYEGLLSYYDGTYTSLEAKNIIKWALQIKQTNPNIKWNQFSDWLLQNYIDESQRDEITEDWTDPNRVKPTITFKNHTKLNSIYNQIKKAANFNQYLKNFIPEGSLAHLTFDIGALTISEAQAETTEPINYWIKIVFNKNKDWSSIPRVVVAGTFMHELIHAEILRQLLTVANSNGSINKMELLDYAKKHKHIELFNAFVKAKTNDSEFQHEYMAKKFITTITSFLKQVYGTKFTEVEYKTVVWMSSLKGTKAWNLLPQSEKDLYINTWNSNYWLWEL